MRLRYITMALSVGAAATAIAIAGSPIAMADPATCVYLGASATQCQTPGNVQINDNPIYVEGTSQYPYWQGDLFHHGRR